MDDNKKKWISYFKSFDMEGMRMILSKDKSVLNLKDNDGKTALIWASYNNCAEMVKMLIEAKADLDLKDDDRLNSLIWRSSNDYVNITRLITEINVKK